MTRPRPISPHLQVYKPQISSFLSIMHRATGVANSLGLIAFVIWIATAAYSPSGHEMVKEFFISPFGMILLGGWSFALYYHLCNGIRHLFWDAGYGFELSTMRKSGVAVLLIASALTAGTWLFVCGGMV